MIVDVQQRLLGAMDEDLGERLVRQVSTLIELAAEQRAEILYTEQYPKGLGPTAEALTSRLEELGAVRLEKVHFDVCASPESELALRRLKRRVVLCGMETHICVQATALSLIEAEHQVIVPFDATLSRARAYHEHGLQAMRDAGARLSNVESLLFHSLGSSRHASFKRLSKMIQ